MRNLFNFYERSIPLYHRGERGGEAETKEETEGREGSREESRQAWGREKSGTEGGGGQRSEGDGK